MSHKRFLMSISLIAVAAFAWSCASGGQGTAQSGGAASVRQTPVERVADDLNALRIRLRTPLTPKEQEALLQPQRLTSIGDMAEVEGGSPLGCLGMGLVTGLAGRGADSTMSLPKPVVDEVIKALVTEEGRSVRESTELVRSRDTSVVLVRGSIPPGASAGTLFDVTIEPQDAAISLEGGFLQGAQLRKYVTGRNRQTIRGDVVAQARGQVVAGAGGEMSIGGAGGRRGMVFEGGKYIGERIFVVRLTPKNASARRTLVAEYLLNRRFRNVGVQPGNPGVNYATAVSDRDIMVRIPPLYKRYTERFADVLRSVQGSYFYGPPGEAQMAQLASQLQNGTPKEKYQASVVLEGIGSAAVPVLEAAVEKGDDWTVLYAATSLAYLERPTAGDLIVRAAGSSREEVRYEAVRLMAQMGGRRIGQVLREKLGDPSGRVAAEAVRGLINQGESAAQMARFSHFDLVAVPGATPGLLVDSSGRPMVVVSGLGTPLAGSVAMNLHAVALGSVDAARVGIITGEGPNVQTQVVDATVDSVLAAVARYNPPFEVMSGLLTGLENGGNLPFKITWLN